MLNWFELSVAKSTTHVEFWSEWWWSSPNRFSNRFSISSSMSNSEMLFSFYDQLSSFKLWSGLYKMTLSRASMPINLRCSYSLNVWCKIFMCISAISPKVFYVPLPDWLMKPLRLRLDILLGISLIYGATNTFSLLSLLVNFLSVIWMPNSSSSSAKAFFSTRNRCLNYSRFCLRTIGLIPAASISSYGESNKDRYFLAFLFSSCF